MNERIRELAEQAKKYALDAMIKITDKEQALKVYSETYDTKFAELIVKDTAEYLTDMANNLYNDDRGAAVALLYEAKELKKRYGVKK